MNYAIIFFIKCEDNSLSKQVQFVETYDDVLEYVSKLEYINDVYYVLKVEQDLTHDIWAYMKDIGKTASSEIKQIK